MKHSRNGYRRGCRCEVCTAAQRDYMRHWTQANRGHRDATCVQCGGAFATKHKARFCSRKCYGDSMSKGVRRRKIGKALRLRVYERDAWVCHICGVPVNRDAVVPAFDAPTIDHVLALANGGAHDESNFATAHFRCNSLKRDRLMADAV